MIESFRHKGLKRFYDDDDSKMLPPELVERIRDILTMLEAAETLEGFNRRPSFRLHPLKGQLKRLLGRHCARELEDHFSLCERQGIGG